jgi:hypothetical protein
MPKLVLASAKAARSKGMQASNRSRNRARLLCSVDYRLNEFWCVVTSTRPGGGRPAGAHAAVADVHVDGAVVDGHAVVQRGAQALLLQHRARALCAGRARGSRGGARSSVPHFMSRLAGYSSSQGDLDMYRQPPAKRARRAGPRTVHVHVTCDPAEPCVSRGVARGRGSAADAQQESSRSCG